MRRTSGAAGRSATHQSTIFWPPSRYSAERPGAQVRAVHLHHQRRAICRSARFQRPNGKGTVRVRPRSCRRCGPPPRRGPRQRRGRGSPGRLPPRPPGPRPLPRPPGRTRPAPRPAPRARQGRLPAVHLRPCVQHPLAAKSAAKRSGSMRPSAKAPREPAARTAGPASGARLSSSSAAHLVHRLGHRGVEGLPGGGHRRRRLLVTVVRRHSGPAPG